MKKILKFICIISGVFLLIFFIGINGVAALTRYKVAEIMAKRDIAFDDLTFKYNSNKNSRQLTEQIQRNPDYGLSIIIHPKDKFLDK